MLSHHFGALQLCLYVLSLFFFVVRCVRSHGAIYFFFCLYVMGLSEGEKQGTQSTIRAIEVTYTSSLSELFECVSELAVHVFLANINLLRSGKWYEGTDVKQQH